MKKIKLTHKLVILFIFFISNNTFSEDVYFDLSEKEIKIQTDFNGKEIIIFGILKDNQNTIISIKGPNKDTRVLKKEKILGLWFNTKKVIYKKIPSLFFITSSAPIKEILNEDTIIKEKLYFDGLLVNAITRRDFIDHKDLNLWNNNLINIQVSNNLFKEYDFKNVEDKLFQTRVYFPANSIPGQYNVTTYQIENKIIKSKKK